MRTILVTDAGRGSAIEIIRSLGRNGWRVIAADSDPRSPGFRSRYVQERLLYPPPETSPREVVNTLFHAARERAIDLIIPVTDLLILPLSAERGRFDGLCKLAMPSAAALDVVTNKFSTLKLADRLGVPVPRTQLVRTAQEAHNRAEGLDWPLVLKPVRSILYRAQKSIETFGVCYAEDREQLTERMQAFEGRCAVLLQEFCSGAGHGVELLMHEGRTLAAFQHKRLREYPISGGVSALRQSVPLDATLYGYAQRLLEALRWTGLAMVEFKVGEQGAKLMEINGRVWGSLPLAVQSGMDFPARLTELCLYGPPGPDVGPETDYRVGIRSRNLKLDLAWIASVLAGGQRPSFMNAPARRHAFAALLQLLNPEYRFDILSFDDPQPGRIEILNILSTVGRKLKEAI